MSRPLSNKTVREKVLTESLDYAILHYFGAKANFQDPELVRAWTEAHKSLKKIIKLLELEGDY